MLTTPGGDLEKRVTKTMPRAWSFQEREPDFPAIWNGDRKCRYFTLTNAEIKRHEPVGGFDYNPFYDMWLCPAEFLGAQMPVEQTEQRRPAVYFADGEAGVLFILSIGQNDWPQGPDMIARALLLEKPRLDKRLCEKVNENIDMEVELPAGVFIDCGESTADTLIMSITTATSLTTVKMDEITDNLARAIRNKAIDKRRALFLRRYGNQSDAVIAAFKRTF